MSPTLLNKAQIFGFRPHGRPADIVGDYHRWKNGEKLGKKNFHSATLDNPLNILASGADLVDTYLAAGIATSGLLHIGKRYSEKATLGSDLDEKELEDEAAKIDFRKKFVSVMLIRVLPFGRGKPPNSHLGCNRGTSWRDEDDLEVHKNCRCAVNKINNSMDALYPSLESNSCCFGDFDACWKARFGGVSDARTVARVVFVKWDAGIVLAEPDAKKFVTQMLLGINAEVIEDPSVASNLSRQVVQTRQMIVNSIIAVGDLEVDLKEEDIKYEVLIEEKTSEATPSARKNKGKETIQAQDNPVQPELPIESPSPSPTEMKSLIKGATRERKVKEPVVAPTTTTETDEELVHPF
ncbi:unnamed protein product [Prunus armeniaca]